MCRNTITMPCSWNQHSAVGQTYFEKIIKVYKLNFTLWDFPGGPVAKTPSSQCRALGSIPAQGTRSCVPQLRHHTEDPTCCSWDLVHPNKYFLKNKSLNDTNQKMQILTYRSRVCVYIYVLCVCVYIYICIYMLTFVIFDCDPGKNKNTYHGYYWANWGNVRSDCILHSNILLACYLLWLCRRMFLLLSDACWIINGEMMSTTNSQKV